ncbi:MAG: hypothetical protein Q9220_002626 [cf. Caloplaca sp. 1 TL-2023]
MDRESNSPLSEEPTPKELPVGQEPHPVFSGKYGEVDFTQDGLDTRARVANDGRVDISIRQQSPRLSNLLVPALRSQLDLQHTAEPAETRKEQFRPIIGGVLDQAQTPSLNVVIHVVGSRGDVQPFVALGKVLKEKYSHRVRLATHPTFRSFVEENGLEFFSIGGDPTELMAFMVKNPGLMPGMDSLRSGDVGKRRKGMSEIVQGCWRSCIEIGDGTGIMASDDHLDSLRSSESDIDHDVASNAGPSSRPFVADAIIANPPSFAHIHCAEKLGIPLHLMFTMPWSPTQAFPHPLANIQSSNADQSMTNFMSYALVEMMTWQGLGDIINRFREKSLGLEPVSLMWAPGMASRLRIPYTYCWSPALIPKPKDWGSHISISGFYFLSLASQFVPDPELALFLGAGPPPVYIGFGSIVVDDPNAMTAMIFDAVRKSGQRALVSKGWGGFGADLLEVPPNVYMLGNVPHDWLFQHVSCVVHHGGAGTTAAGIAAGKPTVVVPFFGDQPFWGAMVAKAGAGPWPIPYKQLTSDKLATAIQEALEPQALQRAQELGLSIGKESGADVGARDFQAKLDVDSLRCSVAPDRAAVWRVKRTNIRLSTFAATVLANEGLLDFSNLKLYRPREYETEDGPWDPITGATSAIMGTMGSMMMGIADLPIEILRALRIKPSENSIVDTKSLATSSSDKTDANDGSQKSIFETTSNIEGDALSLSSSRSSLTSYSPAAGPRKATSVSSHSLDEGRPSFSGASIDATIRQPTTPASGWNRGKSMASSLGGSKSRSSSRGRASLDTSTTKSLSESQVTPISLDSAVGAGKGIGRIVGAGLKSPMDFTLSLARGFHNAPRLYGDESVRHPDKVTGIQTGLKAAGKEFGYGVYDGVSGLFTQPIHGAKHDGVAGFIKGVGKGIGGLLLKPQAAASTQQQRLDVIKRWQAAQLELHKEKQQVKDKVSPPSSCVFLRVKNATHAGLEERRKHSKNGKLHKAPGHSRHGSSAHAETTSKPAKSPYVGHGDSLFHADSTTFEEAIQQSVQATSQGDRQQDEMIERAIRASVGELRAASKNNNPDQAIQRAIQVSVAEAARARLAMSTGHDTSSSDLDGDLHLALQRSISSHPHTGHGVDQRFDDSGVETDDDSNMKTALEASRSVHHGDPKQHDAQLQTAMEQSRSTLDESAKNLEKQRTEEEIVLEYVKKQSLLEEEHRQSLAAKSNEGQNTSTEA